MHAQPYNGDSHLVVITGTIILVLYLPYQVSATCDNIMHQ